MNSTPALRNQFKDVPDASQIYNVLSDPRSIKIIEAAYTGLRIDSSSFVTNLSKRQYYLRLRRLVDLGLVEKQGRHTYTTTSFGSLLYQGHIRTLERMLKGYWKLRAIDILRQKEDFPSNEKEGMIEDLLMGSELSDITNNTYLSGFKVIKNFDRLIVEVMRVLDSAESEIYFASRYHDPHVSELAFRKFSNGLSLHIIDGTPREISLENRIKAIIRTAPNRNVYKSMLDMIKSPRFELLRFESLPISFIVIDGNRCIYETVNYINPQEFTIAIASYDDKYLAERYIRYFELLRHNANTPKLVQATPST